MRAVKWVTKCIVEMANNRKSIYIALAANLLIALTYFIAGAFTNSYL